MPVGISDVSNALKKVILPYVQDNFPKQTILLDQVRKNSGTQFLNNNFYVPLRTSRHSGVVNLASDTGSLRNGYASIGQAYAAVKTITGAFEISELAIAASKDNKGAVEPMLQFQADSLMTDFSRSVNRQFMGDGSGVIAKINYSGTAGTTGTAIPVVSVNPVNGDISATKYIAPGMVLEMGTAVGTVSSVTGSGTVGTVNLTASLPYGSADTNIYMLDGDLNAASETQGLELIIGTGGTFQNLARATTPQWEGQVGTVAGGTLTMSDVTRNLVKAQEFSMTGDRYAIFANQTPYNAYADLLVSYRRYNDAKDFFGGWKGLTVSAGNGGDFGLFLDYDTTDGRIMGVNLDSLTVAEVAPMGWIDDPTSGQPLLRRIDKLTFQAVMRWYVQFMGLNPASNFKLTNVAH